ncbi:MAG: GNAT family N-acetyltransferase [Piscinibacter sp.]
MSDFPLHTWAGPDGSRLRIRPIHPDDEPALAALFAGLDPLSRRRRFHAPIDALTPQWLHELAEAGGEGRTVLVATAAHAGHEALVAEARCVADASGNAAEFALTVAPRWRRQGIARRCLQALRDAAADAGLRWLYGHVLADNLPMLALLHHAGFSLSTHRRDATLVVAEARCLAAPPPVPAPPPAARRFALFHPFTR